MEDDLFKELYEAYLNIDVVEITPKVTLYNKNLKVLGNLEETKQFSVLNESEDYYRFILNTNDILINKKDVKVIGFDITGRGINYYSQDPLLEAKHSRKECMQCSNLPTKEVQWAEGIAHAWFCEECFKEWYKEHRDDVISIKKIDDGEASLKFYHNDNENIKEANYKEYIRGTGNIRTYFRTSIAPTQEQKNKEIISIKADPILSTMNDEEDTFKFWWQPYYDFVIGDWGRNHEHVSLIWGAPNINLIDKSRAFKGRLSVRDSLTWLFIYRTNERGALLREEDIITYLLPILTRATGQHIELVIDDNKNLLNESQEELNKLYNENRFVEYAKVILPDAYKSWKTKFYKTGLTEAQVIEDNRYNEYWKMMIFGRHLFRRFLKETGDNWKDSNGNIILPDDYLKTFIKENKEEINMLTKRVRMEENIEVKFYKEDSGNLRKYYKVKGGGLVCTQPDENKDISWYSCSMDGEPSHKLNKDKVTVLKEDIFTPISQEDLKQRMKNKPQVEEFEIKGEDYNLQVISNFRLAIGNNYTTEHLANAIKEQKPEVRDIIFNLPLEDDVKLVYRGTYGMHEDYYAVSDFCDYLRESVKEEIDLKKNNAQDGMVKDLEKNMDAKQAKERVKNYMKESEKVNEDDMMQGGATIPSQSSTIAQDKPKEETSSEDKKEEKPEEAPKKEEEKKLAPGGEKEYLGNNGSDQYFYLVRKTAEDGDSVDELEIQDAEENVLFSSKEEDNMDTKDIKNFVLQGIKKAEIANISFEVVNKYILSPESEKKEEAPEEIDIEKEENTEAAVPTEQNPPNPKPNESIQEAYERYPYEFSIKYVEDGQTKIKLFPDRIEALQFALERDIPEEDIIPHQSSVKEPIIQEPALVESYEPQKVAVAGAKLSGTIISLISTFDTEYKFYGATEFIMKLKERLEQAINIYKQESGVGMKEQDTQLEESLLFKYGFALEDTTQLLEKFGLLVEEANKVIYENSVEDLNKLDILAKEKFNVSFNELSKDERNVLAKEAGINLVESKMNEAEDKLEWIKNNASSISHSGRFYTGLWWYALGSGGVFDYSDKTIRHLDFEAFPRFMPLIKKAIETNNFTQFVRGRLVDCDGIVFVLIYTDPSSNTVHKFSESLLLDIKQRCEQESGKKVDLIVDESKNVLLEGKKYEYTPFEKVINEAEEVPFTNLDSQSQQDAAAQEIPDVENEADYSTPEAARSSIQMEYPEEPLTTTAIVFSDSMINDPKVYRTIRKLDWEGIYGDADILNQQAKIVGDYRNFSSDVIKLLTARIGNGGKYRLGRKNGSPTVDITIRDPKYSISLSGLKELVNADTIEKTGEPGEVKLTW